MDEQPVTPTSIPENMNQIPVPKKGLHIKTIILIFILTFVALGLTTIAVMNKPAGTTTQQAKVSETPALANPVQTTLVISSPPVRLSTPSAFSTDIIINTGQDPVNKVQLELSYDPKVLTKVDINTGTFFNDPQVVLKNIDTTTGRISLVLGVQNGVEGIMGQGVLATLNFTVEPKIATASVTLLPKTQVTADGYTGSVLKSVTNGNFENLNLVPAASRTATSRFSPAP